MGEIVLTESKVYWKRCRNGSFLLRSKDSGWKFFHPGNMTVIGEGIIVITYSMCWQFFISRSERKADGTWEDVETKSVTPDELSEYFDSRERIHTPEPLPDHVDVTIPEELIDDCD